MARMTTRRVREKKGSGEPFPMVTVYDYAAARLAAAAGIDVLLVGDSIGTTVLGYEDTLPVTVEDIVRASGAVSRGAPEALVVADMPFMSYQVGPDDALRNAGRLVKEGLAEAVKLEGGSRVEAQVRAVDRAGIAVMGHLGLVPQSVHKLGGYHPQATAPETAEELIEDALRLEDAGVFAIVLELIPVELAEEVTERVSVPTIGIGSGPACDGQVQVWHDVLGLSLDFTPRHAKVYTRAGEAIRDALADFASEVRSGSFPTEAQSVRRRRDAD